MTKAEVLDAVKGNSSYVALHRDSGGTIQNVKEYNVCSGKFTSELKFEGDCSPESEWDLEYLAAR